MKKVSPRFQTELPDTAFIGETVENSPLRSESLIRACRYLGSVSIPSEIGLLIPSAYSS